MLENSWFWSGIAAFFAVLGTVLLLGGQIGGAVEVFLLVIPQALLAWIFSRPKQKYP